MLLGHDNNVDDCPISNDAKKGLKCIVEVFNSEAADDDGSYETEGDEDDSGNTQSPRPKVLSVQREGVVVGNVILSCVSQAKPRKHKELLTGIELNAANAIRNFPNPPAGSSAMLSGPPTPAFK